GRVREPVGGSDHEGLEGVLGVEPGLTGRRGTGRRLVADRWRGDVEVCRHIGMWTCRLIDEGALEAVLRGVDPFGQGRVDGDREPDLVSEPHRERVAELTTESALELGAGELVADRDDRGVAVQRDRFAGAHPGLLVGVDLVDHVLPGASEVGVVVHRKYRSLYVALPSLDRWLSSPHRRKVGL